MECYMDNFDDWIKPDRSICLDPEHIDAISAINIAHLTNTLSVLPLAYTDVCSAGSAVMQCCMR